MNSTPEHNGVLVGMITDRDIACRAIANGADLDALHARDIMSRRIATCSAQDDLMTAVARMRKNMYAGCQSSITVKPSLGC
jgi:CBS domain-containing protein